MINSSPWGVIWPRRSSLKDHNWRFRVRMVYRSSTSMLLLSANFKELAQKRIQGATRSLANAFAPVRVLA